MTYHIMSVADFNDKIEENLGVSPRHGTKIPINKKSHQSALMGLDNYFLRPLIFSKRWKPGSW